jgi:hypothetical protein
MGCGFLKSAPPKPKYTEQIYFLGIDVSEVRQCRDGVIKIGVLSRFINTDQSYHHDFWVGNQGGRYSPNNITSGLNPAIKDWSFSTSVFK